MKDSETDKMEKLGHINHCQVQEELLMCNVKNIMNKEYVLLYRPNRKSTNMNEVFSVLIGLDWHSYWSKPFS